jgi:hypothetical protein
LHLLDYVQAAVDDELVQMPGLVAEARLAVAALLGGSEVIFEQGVVLGANYGEIIGHCFFLLSVDHLFVVQLELRVHDGDARPLAVQGYVEGKVGRCSWRKVPTEKRR